MPSELVKFIQSPPMLERIAKANATGQDPQSVAAAISLTISKSRDLQACDPMSVMECALTCLTVGLVPDSTLGLAYLVPFGKTCTLIIGYKGFVQLGYRSGQVKAWHEPQIVFENEPFDVQRGDDPRIIHRPVPPADRGKPIAVYNVVELIGGGKLREVMYADEIAGIKARIKAKRGPWFAGKHELYPGIALDELEMWRKSPVRRIAKYVPQSPTFQHLAAAVALDEMGETGTGEQYPGQLQRTTAEIEAELKRVPFDVEQVQEPEKELDPEVDEIDPPSESDLFDPAEATS